MTKEEYFGLKHFYRVVKYKKIHILVISSLIALITLVVSLKIPPRYRAEADIMMPEATKSGASSIGSALGILSPRFSSAQGMSSQLIQVMLESKACREYIVNRFDLVNVYKAKSKDDAAQILLKNTKIGIFTLKGIIKIQVEDKDPERAAVLANYYIKMINIMNNKLKITTDYPIVRTLDAASVPKLKVFPRVKLNVLISFLISLLLSTTYYVLYSKIE